MWKRKHSIKLSLAVCYFLSVLLFVLLFAMPWLFDHYMLNIRGFTIDGAAVKLIKIVSICCFYSCAVFAGVILYSLISLLRNILHGNIFVDKNVKNLRVIAWSCFIIAIITFVGGLLYLPFMFIAFAVAFVGIFIRVLKNIMQSAVEIREENDLTI